MLQDHNSDPVRYRNIWIRRLKGYDQPEKIGRRRSSVAYVLHARGSGPFR